MRYAECCLTIPKHKPNWVDLLMLNGTLPSAPLRRRAGITGGTEKLPTTVDSYLQQVFYPNITNPVLLEIRRERAIELVAEGTRFNDLRRWKCGELIEELPWTGMHISALNVILT